MDLTTITLDRIEANRQVLAYRKAVKARQNAEDEAILKGYRALAKGHQLLNLTDALRRGGVDDRGLPRLAVMKADERWCYVDLGWQLDGAVTFSSVLPSRVRGNMRRGVYRFGAGTLAHGPGSNYGHSRTGLRSQVPMVPPGLRPNCSLAGYEILWEVPEWQPAPRPPGDPALLRHITGDLYAVVAIWDLTELERAVLGARAVR